MLPRTTAIQGERHMLKSIIRLANAFTLLLAAAAAASSPVNGAEIVARLIG